MAYPSGYANDQPLDLGVTTGDGTAYGIRKMFQIIQGGPAFADLPIPKAPLPATGYISVRAWGAKGDSITDDTVAIKEAIAAVPPRGTLYFPAGIYAMTAGATLAGSNINIVGEGANSIISCFYSGASANDFVLWSNNFDDVTIRDLTFIGTHSGAVSLYSGARCRLLRLNISGATNLNTQGFCAGIYAQDNDDLEIDGNVLFGNGRATGESHGDIVCNTGTYRLTNSRITNNRCSSTLVNYNIGIYDARNVTVSGNTCTGAIISPVSSLRQGYGIMLYHTAGIDRLIDGECNVSNNTVYTTGGSGIYIQDMRDTIVSGNVVRDTCTAQDDSTLPVAGISLDNAGPYVCTGNRVYNSTKDGIAFSSTVGSTCTGNLVSGITQNGISLRGVCTDILIGSNEVISVGRDGIGMWSDTAATRITVTGNRIRTLTGAGTSKGIEATAATSEWQIDNNAVSGIGANSSYAVSGTNHSFILNKTEDRYHRERFGADIGDGNVTVNALDPVIIYYRTVLTANRTVTLPTAPILKGHKFRVLRTGLGAFTVDVGGLKTLPSGVASYADVEWNDSPGFGLWTLTGYGLL